MKRDVLLLQVLEHPDDDQLRLVYADSLSEKGDPRGELIAVQCALAAAPTEALRARETELLRLHREVWFGPLETFLRERNPEDAAGYVVKRGFVEHLRARLRGQPGEVTQLFKLVPALRSLEVNGEGLTPSNSLRRLERLTITGIIGELSELLTAGYFDKLTSLDLQVIDGEPGPGLSRLDALTEFRSTWALRDLWPLPRKLQVLDGYGEDIIRSQLSAPRKTLRELGLRSANLDADCIESITKQAPYLEKLMLKMSRAGSSLFERLFEEKWPHLTTLEFHGVPMHESIEALRALRAPKLSHLVMTITQLHDDGARRLLSMPWFSQLKSLNVSANRLTDDSLGQLLEIKHHLTQLNLQRNQASTGLIAKLKRHDSLRQTSILL